MPATTKRKKSALAQKVGQIKQKPKEPFWKGPAVDGITQSMLSQFLSCRERFRVRVIEGLQPEPKFEKTLEFGNMWHICEEHHAAQEDWQEPLRSYAVRLTHKYRESSPEIAKWYNVCLRQFPIYVEYWSKHPDVKSRQPFMSEVTFKVPYTLPSGREVLLKGKWDSVDFVGNGKKLGIWLQENKTSGDIREALVEKRLLFDLQTGIYMVALEEFLKAEGKGREKQLQGVRYNVIRRPLSGGRHSIQPRKEKRTKNTYTPAETESEYYDRLAECIRGEPEFFFMRWNVPFTQEDLTNYRVRMINPILEQLCDWYDWIQTCLRIGQSPFDSYQTGSAAGGAIHWQHPYGVYNVMDQGGVSDIDEYVMTGNRVGLVDARTLYPELEEDEE